MEDLKLYMIQLSSKTLNDIMFSQYTLFDLMQYNFTFDSFWAI